MLLTIKINTYREFKKINFYLFSKKLKFLSHPIPKLLWRTI